MPQYIVMNRRDSVEPAKSALDAVSNERGISVVSGENPHLVTIEADKQTADRLKKRLRETHHVEPVVHRSLD